MSLLLLMAGDAGGGGPVPGGPVNSLDFDSGTPDWLSMSSANFGAYDRDTFAIACAVYCDTITAAGQIVMAKWNFTTAANREFRIDIGNSGEINIQTRGVSGGQGNFTSANNVITAAGWYAILVHFDMLNATSGDRIKLWVNDSPVSALSYTAPAQEALNSAAEPVTIGRYETFSPFNGNIYQLSFISGVLTADTDVFAGSAGKMQDLSATTGLYSYLDAVTATSDGVLATDWTDNGSVTTEAFVP